jgi:hypothetical protein
MMTNDEVQELAETLRRLLALMDAGDLVASTATQYRLQGALAALEGVLGRSSTLVADLSVADEPPPA